MASCPNCHKELPNEARFCDACGTNLNGFPAQGPPYSPQQAYQQPYQQPYYPNPYYTLPVKNDGIAIILAFLIPGLGHIYIGRVGEGALYLVISIILGIVALALIWLIIPLILPFIFWIWQIVDVHNKTNQYNSILSQTGRAPW